MVANECAVGSDKSERDNVEADRHVGRPFAALVLVFTSTNTMVSPSRAMMSASPAMQVQLRSTMS